MVITLELPSNKAAVLFAPKLGNPQKGSDAAALAKAVEMGATSTVNVSGFSTRSANGKTIRSSRSKCRRE